MLEIRLTPKINTFSIISAPFSLSSRFLQVHRNPKNAFNHLTLTNHNALILLTVTPCNHAVSEHMRFHVRSNTPAKYKNILFYYLSSKCDNLSKQSSFQFKYCHYSARFRPISKMFERLLRRPLARGIGSATRSSYVTGNLFETKNETLNDFLLKACERNDSAMAAVFVRALL